jgi:hypothetical protein
MVGGQLEAIIALLGEAFRVVNLHQQAMMLEQAVTDVHPHEEVRTGGAAGVHFGDVLGTAWGMASLVGVQYGQEVAHGAMMPGRAWHQIAANRRKWPGVSEIVGQLHHILSCAKVLSGAVEEMGTSGDRAAPHQPDCTEIVKKLSTIGPETV